MSCWVLSKQYKNQNYVLRAVLLRGPSTVQEERLRRRHSALAFRHRDVSGSQVTETLPRGLVTLFGHASDAVEQELYQAYKMRSLHAI